MHFVDSHCHLNRLDLTVFNHSLNEALDKAEAAGVTHFLNVCVHPKEIKDLLESAQSRSNISLSIGLHPTETIEKEPTVEDLVDWARHPKVVALGETGLDYCQETDRSVQQQRFRNHIRAAKQVQKPLIIHTRCAVEDTLRILEEEDAKMVGGVLHCFTETLEMALTAIQKLNFYISFSGILTFKNAHTLKEIARQLPLDRLLIETDSPYLTPVPFRGKQSNYPGYVSYVAQTLAELQQTDVAHVAEQTSQNFFELFYKSTMPKNTSEISK